jgi:hypothetical protein
MKKTLNIDIDPAMMMTVSTSLKHSELGRLFSALAARMAGEDAEVYLNNSGLRLAFALLSPAIDDSLQRLALNRANGAKGGRPRKHPVEPVMTQNPSSPEGKNHEETSKKSKKEDLSPTPPIEEKNKKNKIITPSHSACAGEEKWYKRTVPVYQTVVLEWEELHEQMLHEQPWLDELCMSRGIGREDMEHYIADFIKYLRERDLRETLPHAKGHFVNQLPYIIKIYKTNQDNHENNQRFIADPVARRQSERESRRQAVCHAIAGLAAQGEQPAVNPF